MTLDQTAKIARWLLGVGLTVGFLAVMLSTYGGHGRAFYRPVTSARTTDSLIGQTVAAQQHARIADSLALVLGERVDGLDSPFATNVTLTNHSAAPVKDVVLACEGVGETGATIGHATVTLHAVFPAHEKKLMSNVTVHFLQRNVVSMRCAIDTFSIES